MDNFTAIFDSQVVYALGWTIVHSFWQCLLVFSLMKICLLLSKKTSPQTHYWISIFTLACCLFISTKTFMIYYQDITTVSQLYVHIQDAVNLSDNTLWSTSYQIINPWLDSIVFIWCLGFLFQAYRFVADILLTRTFKHQGVSNLPEQWEQQLQILARQLEVKTKVSFLQSSNVNIPVVIGYLKPVVLLPLGILTQLPEAQIKAIVLHELAHIKRHDYLINIIQCMVKVLFFFNPFVLAISKQIDIQRENACDDIAVKTSGDPLTFARSLSSFAEVSANSQTALAATKDHYFLLSRVKRLFSKKQALSQTTERLIALLCIGMLGLTINVHANNAPTTKDPDTLTPKEVSEINNDGSPVTPVYQNKTVKQPTNAHITHDTELLNETIPVTNTALENRQVQNFEQQKSNTFIAKLVDNDVFVSGDLLRINKVKVTAVPLNHCHDSKLI